MHFVMSLMSKATSAAKRLNGNLEEMTETQKQAATTTACTQTQ
jgi:hypothetical protein